MQLFAKLLEMAGIVLFGITVTLAVNNILTAATAYPLAVLLGLIVALRIVIWRLFGH